MLLKRPSQIKGLSSNEPFSKLNWEGNQHTLKGKLQNWLLQLPILKEHPPCFPRFYQLSKHREIPGKPGWQQSHPAFQLPDGFDPIAFLVVEPTHLKNMRKSKWIISPIFGVNMKNSWNHYLFVFVCLRFMFRTLKKKRNEIFPETGYVSRQCEFEKYRSFIY